MRKLFSLLAAVLFAGSMFAAVGNLYYTFATAKNSSNTNYASNYDVTIDGMDWSVPGNQSSSGYLGIGGKSLNGVDRIISSKTPMGDAIAKIKISHNGTSSDNLIVNSITIVAASNAAFTTDVVEQVLTPTISKQVAGAVEFIAEAGSWAEGSFYQIKFNLTNATTKNYRFDVTKIEFFSYQDDSAPAIMAEKIDFGLVASTVLPAVQNAELAVTGANLTDAIAYSVIGENVTVTGSLTAAGGTLNVALSANAEGEISDTIVLTSATTVAKVPVEAQIVKTDGDGSKENPFSVADVVKLNNGYGMEKYWVMGYIVGSAANGGALAAQDVASNIALGDAANQTEELVPVELPSGDIRTALNIVDHAENKGKLVKVHGQLISYFSWSGVKATDDYEFVTEPEEAKYCEKATGHLGDANFADANGRILLTIAKGTGNNVIVKVKNNNAAGNTKTGLNYLWVNAEGSKGVVRYGDGSHNEADVEEVSVVVEFEEARENYNFINIHWSYSGWEGEWALDGLQVKASELCDEGSTPTAIDNTVVGEKAIKTIENGQLVIIKNGVRYDATGAVIR